LYFLMKPRGSRELNDSGFVYESVRERMVWLPVDKLNKYKLFPLFFKDRLNNLSDSVVHIVTEEYDRNMHIK